MKKALLLFFLVAATFAVATPEPVRVALQYWQPGDYPGNERWGYSDVWVEGHWEDYGHWEDTDGDGWEDTWYVDGQFWVADHWESQWGYLGPDPDGAYGSTWDTTIGTFDIGDPGSGFDPRTSIRGSLLYNYSSQYSWEQITFRAWGLAPSSNCNTFRGSLYSPNNVLLATGTFTAGSYWQVTYFPNYGNGAYRIDISYLNATSGASPSTGTVSYYIPVGQFAPQIIAQPESLTAVVGSTASFKVVANGTQSFAYQWRRNGTVIPGDSATLTIPNVQAAQSGTYTASVSNSWGTAYSAGALLTVVAPPSITSQPVGQTVNVGQAVTFNVIATGGSLSYQWRRNGLAIAGATGPSYGIGSAQGSDAAAYSVVVSNSVGTVTSTNATLAVTGPTITTHPVNRSVNAGEATGFVVYATGGSLSYQWQLNGSNIPGATGAGYPIYFAHAEEAGTYTVVVSNSAGSVTSNPALLTVAAVLPTVTIDPTSQSQFVGQSFTLRAGARGTTPIAYQWLFNGLPIAGATNSVLEISNAQPGDTGTYSFEVSNSVGSSTSAAALVTVSPAPPIRLALQYWQPGDYPGNERWGYGDVLVDGHWEDYGHWEDTDGDGFDDTFVTDGQFWVAQHWESQWGNLGPNPNGAEDPSWNTTAGTFDIADPNSGYAAATIQRGEFNSVYHYTDTIAFRAWGSAPAGNCNTYQAKLYGPTGNLLASGSFTSGNYWQRTFRPVDFQSGGGLYRIDISYANATAGANPPSATVSYYLVVDYANLQILSHPQSQTVPARTSAALSVVAVGYPPLSYQWLKNGVPVGGNSPTLSFANLQAADAGTYTVNVSSSSGTIVSSPAVLTIGEPHYTLTVQDGVPASWRGPAGSVLALTAATPPAGQYFGSWSLVSGSGSFASTGTASSSFTIGAADTVVRAVMLADTAAPSTPGPVSASEMTSSSVKLSWIPSSDNLGVTAYEVQKNGTPVAFVGSAYFTLTNLTPGVTHAISVRARDAAGNWSGWSSANVSIPVATPGSGQGFTALGTSAGSVFWNTPSGGLTATSYNVYRDNELRGNTRDSAFADTGLSKGANATYVYTIRAVNHIGVETSTLATITATAGASATDDTDADGIPAAIDGLLGSHASSPATADSTNSLRSYVHRPTP